MRNCNHCGKETTNPKYCSLSCGAKAPRTKLIRLVPCKECGIEFSNIGKPAAKFCSRSCSVSHHNKVSPKRKRTQSRGTCPRCGNPTINAVHCSNECYQSERLDNYISRWLAGEESGTTKYGPTNPVKNYIRTIRGEACWECGWARANYRTGRIPLQIDHIDGDAMNNRPDNLRLLCPNCHSLTETFGNSGRKSTRAYRYPR